MRVFPSILFAVLAALVLAWQTGPEAANADSLEIEPVVWLMSEDYPGHQGDDSRIPVNTVYIKTHDGTNWMSVYDPSPWAVDGPAKLKLIIDNYKARGIGVAAWFVPKGGDIEGQVRIAKQVIDTGVQALIADVEPFDGFCNQDCPALAQQFWWRLREERPNAKLGAIYDPRPWHYEKSGTRDWLAVADMALPMCYWEDFRGQFPWDDPVGCVAQGFGELVGLAKGRPIEYVPMISGDSSPDKVVAAVRATESIPGLEKVSLWRRGIVRADVWDALSRISPPVSPPSGSPPAIPLQAAWAPCLAEGCLLQDSSNGRIFVIRGGEKVAIPDPATLAAMGVGGRPAQPVEPGMLAQIPPAGPCLSDGCLLKDQSTQRIFIMYGGAKFMIPDMLTFLAMGLGGRQAQVVETDVLAKVSNEPADGTLVKELGDSSISAIVGGARFPIPSEQHFVGFGYKWESVKIVPPGSLKRLNVVPHDGALVKEFGQERVYQIRGGKAEPIADIATFQAMGLQWRDVRVAPHGALTQIASKQVERGAGDVSVLAGADVGKRRSLNSMVLQALGFN